MWHRRLVGAFSTSSGDRDSGRALASSASSTLPAVAAPAPAVTAAPAPVPPALCKDDLDLVERASQDAVAAELAKETLTPEDREKLRQAQRELGRIRKLTKEVEGVSAARARKRDIDQFLGAFTRSEKVDLLFVVDCTGSMGPYIRAVKDKVVTVASCVRARSPALQLRVGFLGYRDLCDANRFQHFQFAEDLTEFQQFVGSVKVSGGGDAAEDVAGALSEAGKRDWVSPTRVLVHIADCPCHGTKYHNLASDDNPSGDPNGLHPEQFLRDLRDGGVQYYFGKITGHTDKMIKVFNDALGPAQPGKSGAQPGNSGEYISVLDLTNLQSLAREVIKSISVSISTSFELVHGRTPAESQISIEETCTPCSFQVLPILSSPPEWDKVKIHQASVFSLPWLHEISDVQAEHEGRPSRPSSAPEGSPLWFRISPYPFAEGESRFAIWAQLGTTHSTGADDTSIKWATKVAKQLKTLRGGEDDWPRYLAQVEISNIAAFLAHEYNEEKKPEHKSIEFLQSHVVDVAGVFYSIEKALPLDYDFVKYASNSGYWNDEKYNPTLGAFTRWTLRATGGYLIVSDLQGLELENKFMLTDSALLCTDLSRFGGTNLGPNFMKRVLTGLDAVEEVGRKK